MLTRVADRVLVHESECIQSNTVVVQGNSGVLLVDPGLTVDDLLAIADGCRESGQPVVAGFATHADWDHALWHAALGDAPRYATARCAEGLREVLSSPDWESHLEEGLPPEIAGEVPWNLFGRVSGLPEGSTQIPWDGPRTRLIEHQAHAPGHGALLIEELGVLVAGDMLSDVLVPMLDVSTADPIQDYLDALGLLESVASDVAVVVPGHGSVGGADELRARLELDRAYVEALRTGGGSDDPRIGPEAKEGWEWVSDVHEGQLQSLSERGDS
ncbi:lactamase [Knoellia sinensis KCTC 19936]|uniref:Lactamase n=1 Tax=Knoellia sinensis KCTC 19936 TaxID=1385520 RepID=A0A0A0J1J1_9MICO|nr:MBL fold metallo-hydrolase [Knoellia sinensis]KGN31295.1 lactamase [Knoellia sinensis KCTC 19936]